jgi:hypothetical protein
MSKFELSRRGILSAGLAGLAFGAASKLGRFEARAAEGDEHFFIFIELKGGVQWTLATDARDPASLPMSDADIVVQLPLSVDGNTPPLTPEEVSRIVDDPKGMTYHGNRILLPYIGSVADSYKTGTTKLGAGYTLGFAGFPLLPLVDEIAVVRGSRVAATFHGMGNDEIFCGIEQDRDGSTRQHVAGVLSSLLAKDKGSRLLDNIVIEGAQYTGDPGDFALPETRLDVRTLGHLAQTQLGDGAVSLETRLARGRNLAESMKATAGGTGRREAFEAYIAALQGGPTVQKKLADIASSLQARDASLDLDLQVDTALTLMESGLTRVSTLCLGANNPTNMTDSFGLFDAHYGLLHPSPYQGGASRTYLHYKNLEAAMKSIARLVSELKKRRYNNKSLWSQTTIVISTEYARPSNCAGNEDSDRFGNGHYQWNNNYVLMGKGVRGGAWIGKNDPVTQYSHLVKMTSLDQTDPTRLETRLPPSFTLGANGIYDPGPVASGDMETTIQWIGGDERPIMAKDVVRTIVSTAGYDNRFRAVYTGNWFSDARILKPVTG